MIPAASFIIGLPLLDGFPDFFLCDRINDSSKTERLGRGEKNSVVAGPFFGDWHLEIVGNGQLVLSHQF